MWQVTTRPAATLKLIVLNAVFGASKTLHVNRSTPSLQHGLRACEGRGSNKCSKVQRDPGGRPDSVCKTAIWENTYFLTRQPKHKSICVQMIIHLKMCENNIDYWLPMQLDRAWAVLRRHVETTDPFICTQACNCQRCLYLILNRRESIMQSVILFHICMFVLNYL